MPAVALNRSGRESEPDNCAHCRTVPQNEPCPRCLLEFSRSKNIEYGASLEISTDEVKKALPHLRRLTSLSSTRYGSTFRARYNETGESIILRIFRHDPLKSEELFRFSRLIENAKCEVLTETLEIGEIGSFCFEVLRKPAGNTLSQLVGSGQLEIEEVWRVAGMVNRYSFHLQSLGLSSPPPADRVYLAADGSISVLIGPSDLIHEDPDVSPDFKLGDVIANKYRLLSCIGEGGSSYVFEAEQLHPIARLVALKISKSGGVVSETNRQFEVERCSLVQLDHPNIARILDAGFAAEGKPFLAVALIRHAVPITEYCATNELSLEQSLRMFISVCEAVDYAHRKGIIHRDLKPTNILVANPEADNSSPPVIKVLDFGIARSTLRAGKTQWDRETSTGTPDYMAPEQNSGSGDARMDVFALGRVLSELLEQNREAGQGTSRLELIALKAQQQKPQNRHASPADLAACINKFLNPQSDSPRRTLRGSIAAGIRSQLRKITQSLNEPK